MGNRQTLCPFFEAEQSRNRWDFTRLSDVFIRKNMSVKALRTKEELLGTACIPMEYVPSPRKAIRTARTFAKATKEYDFVAEAVSGFAATCGEKLRRQNSVANLLTVFVRTNKFDSKQPYYANSFTLQIPATTAVLN